MWSNPPLACSALASRAGEAGGDDCDGRLAIASLVCDLTRAEQNLGSGLGLRTIGQQGGSFVRDGPHGRCGMGPSQCARGRWTTAGPRVAGRAHFPSRLLAARTSRAAPRCWTASAALPPLVSSAPRHEVPCLLCASPSVVQDQRLAQRGRPHMFRDVRAHAPARCLAGSAGRCPPSGISAGAQARSGRSDMRRDRVPSAVPAHAQRIPFPSQVLVFYTAGHAARGVVRSGMLVWRNRVAVCGVRVVLSAMPSQLQQHQGCAGRNALRARRLGAPLGLLAGGARRGWVTSERGRGGGVRARQVAHTAPPHLPGAWRRRLRLRGVPRVGGDEVSQLGARGPRRPVGARMRVCGWACSRACATDVWAVIF